VGIRGTKPSKKNDHTPYIIRLDKSTGAKPRPHPQPHLREKGVRKRGQEKIIDNCSGEGGIGVVPCEVADDRSDGERGVGQAKSKARGLGGKFLG
jgi:hypothetical protein